MNTIPGSNPANPIQSHRLVLACLLLLTMMIASFSVRAASVVINPQTLNYWAGVNTSNVLGVGSNSVVMAGADGVSTINLTAGGQPGGLTMVLSTNSCTNTIPLGVVLRVTNVLAGAYSFPL